MQGGHNKVSSKTKALRGTARKDRAAGPAAPPCPANVGDPPDGFTAGQKRSWAELAPAVAGVYADTDRPMFKALVRLHARIEEPEKPIADYAYAQLITRLARMLDAFGCSPRSRKFVESSGLPTGPVNDADQAENFLFNPTKLKAVK